MLKKHLLDAGKVPDAGNTFSRLEKHQACLKRRLGCKTASPFVEYNEFAKEFIDELEKELDMELDKSDHVENVAQRVML